MVPSYWFLVLVPGREHHSSWCRRPCPSAPERRMVSSYGVPGVPSGHMSFSGNPPQRSRCAAHGGPDWRGWLPSNAADGNCWRRGIGGCQWHIAQTGKPGRSIVASCDAPTEKISEFVDYHLRLLVKNIPSYIKDTTDFLHKVQSLGHLPDNTLLVTLDVSSLYTTISHQEGIAAYAAALNTVVIQAPPPADLVTLISEILTKNSFVFGDHSYLQVHGTAMSHQSIPFLDTLGSLTICQTHWHPPIPRLQQLPSTALQRSHPLQSGPPHVVQLLEDFLKRTPDLKAHLVRHG